MKSPRVSESNGLITALPEDQRGRFLAHASEVTLPLGKVVSNPEQAIEHVYFPVTCVLSVLSVTTDGRGVETAVVGREGMAPIAAFHQLDSAAEQTLVQVPGTALRFTRNAFHTALAEVPAMRPQLHRFSQALFTFASQSSGCNRNHSVVQRCARWLLTTHDRVPGDEFFLTHLFLSQMLGVRRSSVSVAAELLRTAGAITYSRGKVRIADRRQLEERGCECYAIIGSTYDRLLAGRDTPSPLAGLQLSDNDQSLVGAGSPEDMPDDGERRFSPPHGFPIMPAEESLGEFSGRLRNAQERTEAFRAQGAAETVDDREQVVRLAEELSKALEELVVAEEEMRVQMEALAEMRTALESQHQTWRARFDGLPDAFIETDRDDTIVELNRAAEQLIGRPREVMLGKPLPTLFPDTERRSLRDVIGRLRHGDTSARWSGTLIAKPARQAVSVAVAPAHRSLLAQREADDTTYLGARWLLRRG